MLPNASVTVTNQQTGESHPLKTDSAGLYSIPGLTPGTYNVEVQARGMQTTVANDLVVSVGVTTPQNFTLKVAGTSSTVEIQATAPILESASVSVGTVVNQKNGSGDPTERPAFCRPRLADPRFGNTSSERFFDRSLARAGLVFFQLSRRA